MNVTEELRAEFETWARSRPEHDRILAGDHYMPAYTEMAWLAWQEQERRYSNAAETVKLIDELRAEEMTGVDICHDNPDEWPNTVIDVWGDWVGPNWFNRKRRFSGENLLDCLRKAVEAKRKLSDR